ncbi:MAG TPA: hypothetical protein VHH54_02010, partial [Actinomycetota bacterium]|nr:hypothetical protein [Actinomycetota bacterium]
KEGQNARLAAKLTGYRIDIKSESQMADEERSRREPKPKKEEAPAPEAAPTPAAVSEAGPASEEPSGDGSAPLPEEEARILEQAAEAPEVEVAAPGDASVPDDDGGGTRKAPAKKRAEQPEASPSA